MLLPVIPDEVWNARPVLKDVRDLAHRRAGGADAVLWSVLAAVAAFIPARVSIDTGVGTPVRPNLFVVLAGGSGVGKSSSWGVARMLVPDSPEPLPLSTGEGLVESYYGRVLMEQPQPAKPDGEPRPPKLVPVRTRVRSNALFWLDEGETLFRQLERPANTVGAVLRAFWSGGTVGQANADQDTRRILDAGSYTGSVIIALQPDISGRLLADTATGTAQRFVWASVLDPGLIGGERPRVPVTPQSLRLAWTPPTLPGAAVPSVEAYLAQPSPGKAWTPPPPLPPVVMQVEDAIADGIWRHQVALRRGEIEPDEHDTQRTAQQVKVAAVLGWRDGRLHITAEDWQLGEALLVASNRVRDALIDHAEVVVQRDRAARGIERAQVHRAEAHAELVRETCAARIVHLLADRGSVAHAELRRSISAPQRPFVAELLEQLATKGAVVVEQAPGGGRRYRLAPGFETAE